jgi:hypothetical protein
VVDGKGHVLGGRASGRPRMDGKSLVETAWSGNYGEFRILNGISIPTQAGATWHLPEGPFTYWRVRILDFRLLR